MSEEQIELRGEPIDRLVFGHLAEMLNEAYESTLACLEWVEKHVVSVPDQDALTPAIRASEEMLKNAITLVNMKVMAGKKEGESN